MEERAVSAPATDERIRKSGIDLLGNIPWGTHICHFYETKQDLIDILVPYFEAGLESNEFCMWVTSQLLPVEDARLALGKAVKELDKYIQRDQIQILDYTERYIRSGRFQPDLVLQGWVEKEKQALEKGFAGLRLASDLSWLREEYWEAFANYEATVDDVIGEFRMIALCSYALDKCGASEIIDVVNRHQLTLVRRGETWNLVENIGHKRGKKELRESAEKYRSLFNDSSDAIYITARDGDIVDINQAASDLLGYTREELLGMDVRRAYANPDDRPRFQQEVEKSGHVRDYEVKLRKKDGTQIDCLFNSTVRRSSDGSILGYQGIIRDITERKRVEEQLRLSEERFSKAFRNSPDPVGIVTLVDGRYIEVNDSLLRLFGYSREEVIGHTTIELKLWTNREDPIRVVRLLREHGSLPGLEFDFRTKSGEIRRLLMSAEVISIGGETCVIAVNNDVTERKRAAEDLKRLNRDLATLNAIAHSLGESRGLDGVLNTALHSTLRALDLDAGGIYLLDEVAQEVVLAVHTGVSEDYAKVVSRLPLGTGIAGSVAKTGEVLTTTNVPEVSGASYRSQTELEGLQSVASVPLKSKGKVVGVLQVFTRSHRSFSADELRLLETIADEIGLAIENAQVLEKTHELAMTDELTGLYNRRQFYETLDTEIYRSQRYGHSFSLVMLDFDGFKQYNDRFGHTAGDAVLRSLAQTLKAALRKSDIAFRYGGDEFTIILPATDAGRARDILDRIRLKWLQTPKATSPLLENPLGFSAGIAQFPENADTADASIFLADTALYHSKRKGGYRCTLVSDLEALPPDVLAPALLEQVYSLVTIVDRRDPQTSTHSKRVATISEIIGKAIGLSESELANLRSAALLHDIGKVVIPDSILTKPGTLTEDEWELVRSHSAQGARIVGNVKELSALLPLIRHHHEWYDGAGYPDGLKGADIPLGARIISIADAYDTITTSRPYGNAVSHEHACAEIRLCSDTQFDPQLVDAFCRAMEDTIEQLPSPSTGEAR